MTFLRSPIIRRLAALVLLSSYLTACYRWVPFKQPAAVAVAEGKRSVRVAAIDGTRFVLSDFYLADDSLVGLETRRVDGSPVTKYRAVALTDITAIDVKKVSTAGTVAAVAAGLAAAGIVAVLIALSEWECCGPGS